MTIKEAISGLNAMIETQKENFLSLCEKRGYDPNSEEFHVEGEEGIDLGPEFNAKEEEGKPESEEEGKEEDTESIENPAEEADESCSRKNPLKVPAKPSIIKPEAKKVAVKECDGKDASSKKDEDKQEDTAEPMQEDIQDDVINNFKHSPRKAEYERIKHLTDDAQAASLTPEEQTERKSLLHKSIEFKGHMPTDRDEGDSDKEDSGFEGNQIPKTGKGDVERDDEGNAVFADALADSIEGKGEGKVAPVKSGKEPSDKRHFLRKVRPAQEK